jgi:hypothetical protein
MSEEERLAGENKKRIAEMTEAIRVLNQSKHGLVMSEEARLGTLFELADGLHHGALNRWIAEHFASSAALCAVWNVDGGHATDLTAEGERLVRDSIEEVIQLAIEMLPAELKAARELSDRGKAKGLERARAHAISIFDLEERGQLYPPLTDEEREELNLMMVDPQTALERQQARLAESARSKKPH